MTPETNLHTCRLGFSHMQSTGRCHFCEPHPVTSVVCETCHHPSHEGRACGQFCMWDRPGGAPGNGYCHCGEAAQLATLTTTNQATTFFALPVELPELPACAAIRVNGFVFADKRHGNCLLQIAEIWPYGCPFPKLVWEYGFMTTRGRFVDRKEGMRLMLAAGRPSANKGGPDLKVSPAGYRGDELYSEDLY